MGKSPRRANGRRESKNESSEKKRKRPTMDEEEISGGKAEKQRGLRLSEVISDCIKRWFVDTLKEAKAGDINMQVLVGQMYYSGYGVPRDAQKNIFFCGYVLTDFEIVGENLDNKGFKSEIFSLESYNASDSDSDSDEPVENS